MSAARTPRRKPYELRFRFNGTAELISPEGRTAWASDSDEGFREAFEGQEFLNFEEDAADILDYLVDENVLTDDEADAAECLTESLPGEPAK